MMPYVERQRDPALLQMVSNTLSLMKQISEEDDKERGVITNSKQHLFSPGNIRSISPEEALKELIEIKKDLES